MSRPRPIDPAGLSRRGIGQRLSALVPDRLLVPYARSPKLAPSTTTCRRSTQAPRSSTPRVRDRARLTPQLDRAGLAHGHYRRSPPLTDPSSPLAPASRGSPAAGPVSATDTAPRAAAPAPARLPELPRHRARLPRGGGAGPAVAVAGRVGLWTCRLPTADATGHVPDEPRPRRSPAAEPHGDRCKQRTHGQAVPLVPDRTAPVPSTAVANNEKRHVNRPAT